jgi:phosphoribosylformimino-5-aminoimidazole carboxamide ribotide isomerase
LATIPSIDLIASGGVTSTADVDALEAIGCKGVIIGKAIYERSIALEELSGYVG